MKILNNILRSEPDLPKVVDLAAWKAEHLAEPEGPETDGLPARAPKRRGGRQPVRCGRWTAQDWAELAATLAVAAAFLALALQILLV